jgi:hypothetical protein
LLENLIQGAAGKMAQTMGTAAQTAGAVGSAAQRMPAARGIDMLLKQTAPRPQPQPLGYQRHGAIRKIFPDDKSTISQQMKLRSPVMSDEMRRLTMGE